MSKWQPLYKCLLCGRVMAHKDPIDLKEDDELGGFVNWFANPVNTMEKAREHVPSVVAHDCYGHGRNVGAAVFCGFFQMEWSESGEQAKEGENDVSVPRE